VVEPIAILNGRVLPLSQAAISVFDLGFVHGAAVGDMIRTFRHVPFRLDDHLARLRTGIDALGINAAPTDAEFRDAVREVVKHNAGLISQSDDLGIIVFATAGWNPSYLAATDEAVPKCTWGVHTFPLPFALWAEKLRHGQPLVIPPVKHIPAECLDGRIKWRNRVHWFLADRAARKASRTLQASGTLVAPAASALLVDFNGHITESSTANFFIVRDGRILTPRPENTLDGISRRVVFELAAELGIPCEFADITPDEATAADEAFTSSTSVCLMPVATLDGHRIGGATPGPVFQRLMEAWNRIAGLDIVAQILGRRES
jgi:branched-subunit amino acid aminotransferase/4-amino-4-deoxychorismate lyase